MRRLVVFPRFGAFHVGTGGLLRPRNMGFFQKVKESMDADPKLQQLKAELKKAKEEDLSPASVLKKERMEDTWEVSQSNAPVVDPEQWKEYFKHAKEMTNKVYDTLARTPRYPPRSPETTERQVIVNQKRKAAKNAHHVVS
jgi:hypothetical protein